MIKSSPIYDRSCIFRENKLHDIAFWGMRAVIGVIFIVHGSGKFGPGFVGFLTGPLGTTSRITNSNSNCRNTRRNSFDCRSINLEFQHQYYLSLCLERFSTVKGAANFTGDGAYEYDLLLLAACLVIIVAGPGRVSIAHVVKKIPRFLH